MPSALPLDPPQRLVRTLGSRRDPAAGQWLARLPELLRRMLEQWELTPERVVSPGGRSSLVALVRLPGDEPAALKLLAPYGDGPPERAAREAAALGLWDGRGAVRLLRSEPAAGALLLERLHGEMSLRSLPEDKAMLEAASAVRRLWIAPGETAPLRSVAAHTDAGAELLRTDATPPEARALRDEALELRAALLDAPPEQVLLHGDFRQGAVLAAEGGRGPWLAAGPDPLVGERTYDLARLVRDRLHDLVASPGAAAATRRRLHRLADALEVDRERLRGWALYRALESGVRHAAAGDRADGELLLEFAAWL